MQSLAKTGEFEADIFLSIRVSAGALVAAGLFDASQYRTGGAAGADVAILA